MLKAAYDLGHKWRQDAEEAPVLDIRIPGVRPTQKTRHRVPTFSLHAIMTRDEGYFTHPDRILPDEAWERCFHLSLSYGAGHGWQQRHDVTQAICEGAFGMWLQEVWVQPPGPGGDAQHDRFRFRLFVAPGWQMPIGPKILRRPPTYIRWSEYRAALAGQEAAA
jgi:hypothetical protein